MKTPLLIKMLRQKADVIEKRTLFDYSPSSTIEMLREAADKLKELEGECKTLGYAVLKAAKLLTKRNETIKDLEKIAAFYHRELEKKCEENDALIKKYSEEIFKLTNRLEECENGYEGTLYLESCKLHDAEEKIKELTNRNEILEAKNKVNDRIGADFIKLTEENERLRAENTKYEAEHHEQFDKWLKLEEATKRHHSELFEEAKIAVKEDTVRKLVEIIKTNYAVSKVHYAKDAEPVITYSLTNYQLDQTAKEMIQGEGR